MRRPGGIEALAEMEGEKATHQSEMGLRLIHEVKPFQAQFFGATFFILFGAAAQATAPFLVGRAIDQNIARADLPGLLKTLSLLLGVYGIAVLCQRGQTRRIGAVGQHVLASIRLRLFRHLQSVPLNYFDRRPIGDLMSRLLSDVDMLSQFFSQGLTQILGAMVGLVGIVLAMFLLNARLASACFLVIPIMLVTTRIFAGRARKAYRVTRQTVGNVSAEIQEEIQGIKQAQAFNRTEFNIEKFKLRNTANRKANVAAVGITSAFSPVIDVLSTLSTALVMGYGGYLVLRGSLTLGLLAAFLIYVQQFFRPVQIAASVYAMTQSALAGAERIYGVLDEPLESPDSKGARAIETPNGRIAFENVSFGYLPERLVLHDVSFTIEPGQMVAIVGPTGAGKTSIANLIPRFYDIASGTVRIDGHDVRDLKRASLRQTIAMVLQEPFLFSISVADNIAFGRPYLTREDIERAAKTVHAHDFIVGLAKGYDTVLSGSTGMLSQGQRQLLAFARAVVGNPKILILDEATANIDMRTEALIQKALAVLLKNRTSVVIAHRLSTIRNADKIVTLSHGTVSEIGTHEELIAFDGLYATLYRQQLQA